MSRGNRGSRRQRETEEPVEVVPVDDGPRGRERPARAPQGVSFALPVGLGAGVVAAGLAFAGVMVVSGLTGPGNGPEQDAGGVAAARLLAARDMDSWNEDFGTMKAVHARLKDAIAEQRAIVEKNDTRDTILFDEAVDQWRHGTFTTKSPWIPGFDKLFGAPDELSVADQTIREARKRGVESAVKNDGTLVGAAIVNAEGRSVVSAGAMYQLSGAPVATFGDTRVFALKEPSGRSVRIYEHPVFNRRGDSKTGRALVCVTAAPAADVVGAAGAGAGAAFLGAFAVGFILCLGPIKALKRLVVESDALARGELGTRVTTRGPDVIAAVARNVQRLAAVAAQGAASPQVVQQAVEVLPIQDIQAGLAPLRSTDRPASLEIEATSKTCPLAGNDYYDVVRLDEDHTGFFIADIPLRGVAGALYMAQVRALFRAESRRDLSPAVVLSNVNRAFARDLQRGVYVTALYAVLEHSTGVCRFASAQHLPLVFWKREKKGSAKVSGEGIALGLDAGPVFEKTLSEKAVQLERGDRIVLYTDGAITAKNAAGAQYGEEKFYYVVNREAPKNSAAFVNFVANDVDLFHAGAQQLDDFTILTVRRMA